MTPITPTTNMQNTNHQITTLTKALTQCQTELAHLIPQLQAQGKDTNSLQKAHTAATNALNNAPPPTNNELQHIQQELTNIHERLRQRVQHLSHGCRLCEAVNGRHFSDCTVTRLADLLDKINDWWK